MYATHCLIFVYKQPNTVLNFMFCLWVILKFSLDQACYVHTKLELWTRVPIGYIYILYICNKCQGKVYTRLSDWLVYIGIVNVGFMNTAISEDSRTWTCSTSCSRKESRIYDAYQVCAMLNGLAHIHHTTLWWTNIAMESMAIYSGFSH